MESVLVSPCVYVLECEDECWYVGITLDLNKRYAQHLSGKAAGWTRLHKPLRVVEVIFQDASLKLENETTKRYMEKYGADAVKGGSWCKIAKKPASDSD